MRLKAAASRLNRIGRIEVGSNQVDPFYSTRLMVIFAAGDPPRDSDVEIERLDTRVLSSKPCTGCKK